MGANHQVIIEFIAEKKKFEAAMKGLEKANQKFSQKEQLNSRDLHRATTRQLGEQRKLKQKMAKEADVAYKKEKKIIDDQNKEFKARGGFAHGLAGVRRGNMGLRDKATGRMVSGSGLGGASRAVMGPLMGAVGAAAGLVIGAAMKGYQQYQEYGRTLGASIGLGKGKDIKAGVRGAPGSKLGYSMIDTASQVPAMARATGVLGPRELQQGMRATGMDMGETAGAFGSIRNLMGKGTFEGGGKKGSAGAQVFQKIMAAGVESGLEKSKVPEFLQGTLKLAEEQQTRSVGSIDPTVIANQLAMLGKAGPGMQGAAGTAVLGKLGGAMQAPGGGEMGQAFMRQAMGFGVPGGKTSFYDAEKMREKGLGDPKNVQRVMGQINQQFGSGEEGNLALRELTGVSLEQAEALQKIYNSGESAEKQQEEIKKITEASKPIAEQSLDAMKDIGDQVKREAGKIDEGIAIGQKAQKFIEKIEDWQLALVKYLIKLVELVSEMVGYIKDTWGSGKSAEEIKKMELGTKAIHEASSAGMSQAEARQLTKKQIAAGNAMADAQGPGGIPTNLSGAIANAKSMWKGDFKGAMGLGGNKNAQIEGWGGGVGASKADASLAAIRRQAGVGADTPETPAEAAYKQDMIRRARELAPNVQGGLKAPDTGAFRAQLGNELGPDSAAGQKVLKVLVEGRVTTDNGVKPTTLTQSSTPR